MELAGARDGVELQGTYGGLSRVVEAQEEEFCVFVGKTKAGQHVPDCITCQHSFHSSSP